MDYTEMLKNLEEAIEQKKYQIEWHEKELRIKRIELESLEGALRALEADLKAEWYPNQK